MKNDKPPDMPVKPGTVFFNQQPETLIDILPE
jgi:hypothetical protein